MKVSPNFDIREFVPKSIWDRFGKSSTWFIDEKTVKVAEFYKDFFSRYFKNQRGTELKAVIIKVNDWQWGGSRQYSGFRPPDCTVGASLSQHRFGAAFDCEIILVFHDGRREEVDYKEIHKIIQDYESTFIEAGVSRIEDVKIAKGWLHTDTAWIPNQKKILIVGA